MLRNKTAHKHNELLNNHMKLFIFNAIVFLCIQNGIALAAEKITQEGFEAGVVPPDNWAKVQNNPSHTWKIATIGTPHTGTYFANVGVSCKMKIFVQNRGMRKILPQAYS